MNLKEFILKRNKEYKFRLIEVSKPGEKILKFLKNKFLHYQNSVNKFKNALRRISKENLGNFVFFLQVLDFRIWEFKENWQFKGKNNFWGLLERVKILVERNKEDINFEIFKEIISPKESENLARLRYKIYKECLNWLEKKYRGNFENYFKENKKPLDFCQNLFSLRKFRDFSDGFYFLKPNQLLYYEYLLAFDLEKKFEDKLNELTIFADYKILQIFLNFFLIRPKKKYLIKLKKREIFQKNSLFLKELRLASIILGEIIAKKLKIPSFKLDTILWELSSKMKFKIDHPRIKTIFY